MNSIDSDYEFTMSRVYRLLLFIFVVLLMSKVFTDVSNGEMTKHTLIAVIAFLFIERMYPSVRIETKPN
jgi:uncharacterized membrane protein